MKILIVGNMGYVGPGVAGRLRRSFPNAELYGFDIGYFSGSLTLTDFLPEAKLNKQYFGDVREFPSEVLKEIDAVIYLAAISNDPMSAKYEEVTFDVNFKSCIKVAKEAKNFGVKAFVFASSCSIYGAADDHPKTEKDQINPLTAYARSKVLAENGLESLADSHFTVTCLRFATACGSSNRLRLDLVLNDFVAGAVVSNEINILSDGTPWRPLINVLDMATAIEWAIERKSENGGEFLSVNTGSNTWNYQVKELAEVVAEIIPDCKVSVNRNAPPDKRSYKVCFDLYQQLAPNHQPEFQLTETIKNLHKQLIDMRFEDSNFRESKLMRLKMLEYLQFSGLLNEQLKWKW
jgi:nucleoside-diphosphate-sugar epimerase